MVEKMANTMAPTSVETKTQVTNLICSSKENKGLNGPDNSAFSDIFGHSIKICSSKTRDRKGQQGPIKKTVFCQPLLDLLESASVILSTIQG